MKKFLTLIFVFLLVFTTFAIPTLAAEDNLVDQYEEDEYVTAKLYLDETNPENPELTISVCAKEMLDAYYEVEYLIACPVGADISGKMEVNATNLQIMSKSMTVLHSETPEMDVFEILSVKATPIDMGPFTVTLVSQDDTMGAVYFYEESMEDPIVIDPNQEENPEDENPEGEEEEANPTMEVLYGTPVTIQAKPFVNYTFVGWYLDGKLVSRLKKYTFVCKGDAEFSASFIRVAEHEHIYEEPVFEWNKTYTECEMFVTCQMGDAQEKITCDITETIKKEATKQTDGEKVLTAKAVFNGETYTNQVILTIPKIGEKEEPIPVEPKGEEKKPTKTIIIVLGIALVICAWTAVIIILKKKGKLVNIVKK